MTVALKMVYAAQRLIMLPILVHNYNSNVMANDITVR